MAGETGDKNLWSCIVERNDQGSGYEVPVYQGPVSRKPRSQRTYLIFACQSGYLLNPTYLGTGFQAEAFFDLQKEVEVAAKAG